MKKIYTIFSILALTAIVGCQKDPISGEIDSNGSKIIFATNSASLSTSNSEKHATRSNPLENGDAASTFNAYDAVAISKGETETSGDLDKYSKYQYTSGNWNYIAGLPGSEHMWTLNSYFFRAYYPVSTYSDFENFTLPKNQSTYKDATDEAVGTNGIDGTNIENADYMTYSGENHYTESGVVSIDLDRKTARVIIEVVSNTSTVPTRDLDIKIYSKYEKYVDNVLTTATGSQPIEIQPYYKAAVEEESETFTALVLPEKSSVNSAGNSDFTYLEKFITFDANGIGAVTGGDGIADNLRYQKSLKTKLEPGKSYIFRLTVTPEEIIWDSESIVTDWSGSPIPQVDAPVSTFYIYDVQDLNEFARLVNTLGDNPATLDVVETDFSHNDITGILMNDINLSGNKWIPIGTEKSPFKGNFYSDGSERYTLRNLTISGSGDYQGLFGNINGAKIERIVLSDGVIDVDGDKVGLFAGALSNVTLTNCAVLTTNPNTSVKGNNQVGGLVGQVGDSVALVDSPIVLQGINVEGVNDVGGLAGYVVSGHNALVIPNHFDLQVEATGNNVGGVVGRIGRAGSLVMENALDSSEFRSMVKGINNVGGVIGFIEKDSIGKSNKTRISESWTTKNSSVTGKINVGGIIGSNESETTIVEATRNDATIIGTDNIGGLVGKNAGIIVASYNTSPVLHEDYNNFSKMTYLEAVSTGSTIMGGIAGEVIDGGRIIGCFNVGDILVRSVDTLSIPSTTTVTSSGGESEYYGFRGDGIVGYAYAKTDGEGNNVIDNCFYNNGGIDNDIDDALYLTDINNYLVTNAGLGNSTDWSYDSETGAFVSNILAPVKLMNSSINSYYKKIDEQITSSSGSKVAKYAVFAGKSSGTSASLSDPREYPHIRTGDYRESEGVVTSGYIVGGKFTGPNQVDVINAVDALVLTKAIALQGIVDGEITTDILSAYEKLFALFYVDINLHVDLNFKSASESGYEARVQGMYYGTFDGKGRFIHNYTGSTPFFSGLSTSSGFGGGNYFGTFKNTTFVDPIITSISKIENISDAGSITHYTGVGVILGSTTEGTIVSNCHIQNGRIYGSGADGSIDNEYVGGIIGFAQSLVGGCTVDATTEVYGSRHVGGIAGYGYISKAYVPHFGERLEFGHGVSNAKVIATSDNGIAGGLLGGFRSENLSENLITSMVNGKLGANGSVSGAIAGGLIGEVVYDGKNIYIGGMQNDGIVAGRMVVGGIIGKISRTIAHNQDMDGETIASSAATLYACANRGTVNAAGATKVGGLVGEIGTVNGGTTASLLPLVYSSYNSGNFQTNGAVDNNNAKYNPFIGAGVLLNNDPATSPIAPPNLSDNIDNLKLYVYNWSYYITGTNTPETYIGTYTKGGANIDFTHIQKVSSLSPSLYENMNTQSNGEGANVAEYIFDNNGNVIRR